MTTDQLGALDLLVAVAGTATWIGAGAASAARRDRWALGLLIAGVAMFLARVGTVAALTGSGWWFVQEKVTFALPLQGVAGLAAVVLAGSRRGRGRPAGVVALFAAGYAAATGLGVTLLVGYPVTVDVGLLAVALVAGAVLLTWRVMAPAASRRRLCAGLATLAVGLLGAVLAVVPGAPADAMEHDATHGVPVDSIRGPQPAAARSSERVRKFTLTARRSTVTLSSGRRVEAWTYNGRAPGPAITATQGDLVEVRLRNADVAAGVTIHWHGYDVPSGEDGVPGLTQDAVMPGESFVYRFPADQVGTLWYHTHEVSSVGVKMGLFGTLVVAPRGAGPSGLDLTLPVHTFDGTTALGTHDEVDERRLRAGTPVRLRLVNTDSTPHRFAPVGTSYRLVAVDGTDLNRPGEVTGRALRLPAGGRYDLEFTMPARPVALLVDDDPQVASLRLTPTGTSGTSSKPRLPDTIGWPELDLLRYGAPARTPFDRDSRFDRRFTLVLDRGLALVDGAPRYAQTVNGRAFPSVPTQVVSENDLVRFTVVNRSRETHPWHLHGHHVLVLARDGRAPTGGPLWTDTFDVRPGEVWEVGFRAENPGLWMNHCHNLAHADQGMMTHLGYDGVTTPFAGAQGG